MIRNLLKATALAAIGLVGIGSALAQVPVIPPLGWTPLCVDTTPTYSNDYGIEIDWNDLFGVTVGVSGTVHYAKNCFGPNGITNSIKGRIGQMIGPRGSAQDEAYPVGAPVNQLIDAWLMITMGMPDGVEGNWGYAKSVKVSGATSTSAGTTTRTLFGQNGPDTFFYGASDRYFVVEATNDNIRIILRVDILGDAGRLQWQMTNMDTAAVSIGLEYGEWVRFSQPLTNGPVVDPSSGVALTYVTVPGQRALFTDHRFAANPNLAATTPHQLAMPPRLDIGMTQRNAYGLTVPLKATTAIPDQTPVDILDVGKAGFLLGVETAADTPMPPFDSTPAPILEDTSFTGSTAYVERWFPKQTPAGAARTIVAYYQNTWSSTDYVAPYSVVLDAPNLISVLQDDPFTFNINPMVIRVYIDNTRGFSSASAPINLNDVQVTLNLPQGMTDANDGISTKITQFIPVVPFTTHFLDPATGFPISTPMSFVDFPVNVDPTVYGTQNYSVNIIAKPAQSKTVTGSINVASQPKLKIAATGNLVGVPWSFTASDWNTILGTPTFQQDVNYQAFSWDGLQQAYVLQTSPQLGYGTWLISNENLGFVSLKGNPSQPVDASSGKLLIQTGAPNVELFPGWNLIANPYNYSIEIGQIVGVSEANPSQSQTYEALADQGIISPTLAFWDPNTQAYQFTSSFIDLIQPNIGYWVFVNSPQPVTLAFPPVSTPFLPVDNTTNFFKKNVVEKTYVAPAAAWKLGLTIKTSRATDTHNTIGVLKNAAQVQQARIMKPPVAPVASAVSGALIATQGNKSLSLAQSLLASSNTMIWDWQVFTKSAGPAVITWPAITSVPSTVSLTLTDMATNTKIDMRKQSSFTFAGIANRNRAFKITAVQGTVYTGPVLGTISAALSGRSVTSPFNINYVVNTDANVTVKVMQGTKVVDVVANALASAKGSHTVSWTQVDSNNKRVGAGVYTIQITAAAANRAAEVKTVSIFVNR